MCQICANFRSIGQKKAAERLGKAEVRRIVAQMNRIYLRLKEHPGFSNKIDDEEYVLYTQHKDPEKYINLGKKERKRQHIYLTNEEEKWIKDENIFYSFPSLNKKVHWVPRNWFFHRINDNLKDSRLLTAYETLAYNIPEKILNFMRKTGTEIEFYP